VSFPLKTSLHWYLFFLISVSKCQGSNQNQDTQDKYQPTQKGWALTILKLKWQISPILNANGFGHFLIKKKLQAWNKITGNELNELKSFFAFQAFQKNNHKAHLFALNNLVQYRLGQFSNLFKSPASEVFGSLQIIITLTNTALLIGDWTHNHGS